MSLTAKQILGLVCVIISGCAPSDVKPGRVESITIQSGEEKELFSTVNGISFTADIRDSRCPIEAICVWGGEAKVIFEIRRQLQSVKDSLYLPERAVTEEQIRRSQKVVRLGANRFRVELKDVSPLPCISCRIQKNTAVIEISSL